MRVGVTGHQERPGIDWAWVANAISSEIRMRGPFSKALTALAAGSDQVFADCALNAGIPVLAVIPLTGYERFFKGSDLIRYRALLARSQVLELQGSNDPEEAFYAAGKYVVEESDLLFAIWDEKPAVGLGGTADAIAHALELSKKIIFINPITREIKHRGA